MCRDEIPKPPAHVKLGFMARDRQWELATGWFF